MRFGTHTFLHPIPSANMQPFIHPITDATLLLCSRVLLLPLGVSSMRAAACSTSAVLMAVKLGWCAPPPMWDM